MCSSTSPDGRCDERRLDGAHQERRRRLCRRWSGELSAIALEPNERATAWRAFRAVLYRDLYVTWRELPAFLAQVILQPLFMLFVFGKVLGSLGFTRHGYANLLFPGLLALTAVITAMQTLAFPLVAEFGWTKEIEDRLMAPMPTSFVAAEKVLFALLRSFTATLILIPVGVLVLGSIPWRWRGVPSLLGGGPACSGG